MQRSNALDRGPNDYNFRVPPAFLKAEGKYDIRRTQNDPRSGSSPSRATRSGRRSECLRSELLIKKFDARVHRQSVAMPWLEQPEQT